MEGSSARGSGNRKLRRAQRVFVGFRNETANENEFSNVGLYEYGNVKRQHFPTIDEVPRVLKKPLRSAKLNSSLGACVPDIVLS